MRIITFDYSKKIHIYMDGCDKSPNRPYFSHLSIESAIEHLLPNAESKQVRYKVYGTMYVCSRCGSPNVSHYVRVGINSGEILGSQPVKESSGVMELARVVLVC